MKNIAGHSEMLGAIENSSVDNAMVLRDAVVYLRALQRLESFFKQVDTPQLKALRQLCDDMLAVPGLSDDQKEKITRVRNGIDSLRTGTVELLEELNQIESNAG